MKYLLLNNGVKMPCVGLGTYLLSPDDAQNSVSYALDHGYELIDTANAYQNEKAVGRGMKESSKTREEIFLETKLWPSFYEDETAIDRTLKRLGTDYIDLMILHQAAGNYLAGYHQLEEAYKAKKLKAIGISNFTIDEIKNLLAHCEIVPQLIQVEAHPYFHQEALKEFLKPYHIVLQAWYPLGGRGNHVIQDEPTVIEIAKKYHKSPAQIILKWHLYQDNIIIPGSKNEAHILANIDLFDFSLTEDDLAQLNALDRHQPFFVRTDELLERFAAWKPDLDAQK